MMLTLPMPPSANDYWRFVNGRVLVSSDARQYKETAGWLAKSAGLHEPMTGEVSVTLHVYRRQRSGDLDNRIKVLLDSLRGVVYRDDSQVVEIHAYRHEDKLNPRVEIAIEEYLA